MYTAYLYSLLYISFKIFTIYTDNNIFGYLYFISVLGCLKGSREVHHISHIDINKHGRHIHPAFDEGLGRKS